MTVSVASMLKRFPEKTKARLAWLAERPYLWRHLTGYRYKHEADIMTIAQQMKEAGLYSATTQLHDIGVIYLIEHLLEVDRVASRD